MYNVNDNIVHIYKFLFNKLNICFIHLLIYLFCYIKIIILSILFIKINLKKFLAHKIIL